MALRKINFEIGNGYAFDKEKDSAFQHMDKMAQCTNKKLPNDLSELSGLRLELFSFSMSYITNGNSFEIIKFFSGSQLDGLNSQIIVYISDDDELCVRVKGFADMIVTKWRTKPLNGSSPYHGLNICCISKDKPCLHFSFSI